MVDGGDLAGAVAFVPQGISSSPGQAAARDPTRHITLSCPGILPASGYPSNFQRANFPTLTNFCAFNNLGCLCTGDHGSATNCDGRTPGGGHFLDLPAVSGAPGGVPGCVTQCTCLSYSEYLQLPPDKHPENARPYPACPLGMPPAGIDLSTLRNASIPVANYSCVATDDEANRPLFTLLEAPAYDLGRARRCDPCVAGYTDKECLWQPLPLPVCPGGVGPAAAAGNGSVEGVDGSVAVSSVAEFLNTVPSQSVGPVVASSSTRDPNMDYVTVIVETTRPPGGVVGTS